MEKMREEYEAWFCSTMPYKIAKESWFAVMDDGSYIITDVQAGWAGWKASRAALCVEIPTCGEASSFGNYVVFDSDDVRAMLDAAGVRYK
jgi:hypothetical protein